LRHWIAGTLACAALIAASLPAASAEAESALGRFDISRYEVEGNSLLPPEEIRKLLAPHAGARRSLADVKRAMAALQEAYRQRGFTLVQIGLPEQELDAGVVRLRVIESRIGTVRVEGNQNFDEGNIRASVPGLRPGETPDLSRISASLRTANENPKKNTRLGLQRNEQTDAVDATLRVADEKPWSVGLNLDNGGNAATGKTRAGASYQNANFAGLDHVLGLQYTTTVEKPDQVKVYGAGYHIPLYALGDSVDLYASYSDVNSGTVAAGAFDLQVSGSGTVYGARYNQHLGRLGEIESKLAYGLDYKAFRNDVQLLGIQLGSDVTVHPISFGYLASWTGAGSAAAFDATAVRNLPGGERGGVEDFERARAGARAGYSLLRYGASYNRALPAEWQLRLRVNGQLTRDALVSGEQFGAGGAASVRGFSEREIANDKGYAAGAEVYTPEICAVGAISQCRLLAFYDQAYVSRNNALPGESHNTSIGSAGFGLRAAVGRYAALMLDVGRVIDAGPVEQRGDINMHVRLSLSY
jgi:hemolysin activation/secretion protein